MSALLHHLARLATEGIRINLWPCAAGFQANVSDRGGASWTCDTQTDPLAALGNALRIRATLRDGRDTVASGEPVDDRQVDLEDYLATVVPVPVDPFADIFG